MHTLSLQPTPCGAVTSSSQAHSRPVFIGRSPANQIPGIYLHSRNGDLARKATQERLGVEGEIRSLRTASREIRGLGTSTRTHIDGTLDVLAWLGDNAPNDYQQFDTGQKERLAALVNHVRSLGELLRKEVAL